MRYRKLILAPAFLFVQAFAQSPSGAPRENAPRILSVSAYLGINPTDPGIYPNQVRNDMQLTLSARSQAQLNLPVGRAAVFPFVAGYLTGEPTAWEAGGCLGLGWLRSARDSYGLFGGVLEKGHFDITLPSGTALERWHGLQFGLTGKRQSRRFAKLGYVGLAAVQFKESYRSDASSIGVQAYLGLEFGLL